MAESSEVAISEKRSMEEGYDPLSDESKLKKVREIAPGKIDNEKIKQWFSDSNALKTWNEWKGRKMTKAMMQHLTEKVFGRPIDKLVEEKLVPGKPTIDSMRTAIRRRLTTEEVPPSKKRTHEESEMRNEEPAVGSSLSGQELSEVKTTGTEGLETAEPLEKKQRTEQGEGRREDEEFRTDKEEMTVITHAEPPREQEQEQQQSQPQQPGEQQVNMQSRQEQEPVPPHTQKQQPLQPEPQKTQPHLQHQPYIS